MSEVEKVTVEENTSENTPNDKKEKKPKSKARKTIEWVLTILFAGLFVFFAVGQVFGMVNKSKNYGQMLTYNFGTFIIKTDSMEPVYKVDTAIITYKDSAENIVKNFDSGKVVDMSFACAYLANEGKYGYSDFRPDDITYGGITYHLKGNEPVYPTMPGGNIAINTVMTHRLIGYDIDETKKTGEGRYTFVVAGINTEGSYSKEGQYQLLTENELLGIVKVNSKFLGGLFGFITSPWGLLVFLLVPAFYLVITSVLDIFKAIKEPDDEAPAVSSGSSSGSLEGLSEKDKERLKKEMLEEMLNGKKGDGK